MAMEHLLSLPAMTREFGIAAGLSLGYPFLVLLVLEVARSNGSARPLAADILRQVANLLLPSGTIWLILHELAGVPNDSWMVRSAETAFALTGLYLLLRIGQTILMATIVDQAKAPKMLFDILRIGMSLVWGAVVISRIWAVDLGQLFAAMGVGSIVLGFALQEFLGNLLSGLGLLSAQKFSIGDWIRIDGGVARVAEMDWRTVTLIKDNRDRIVVANSTLAKTNLVIAARATQGSFAWIPLSFGMDIPPEAVRDAVAEAGLAMSEVAAAGGPSCFMSGITPSSQGTPGSINYRVRLPIPNPGTALGPSDEFLSRFWYVAQRRGLRLSTDQAIEAATKPDSSARLGMLTKAGAFHGEPDALMQLAEAAEFRRYRRGEVVVPVGTVMSDAVLVVCGSLAISLPKGEHEVRIELVDEMQLLVLQETLTGTLSPVRVVAERDADILAIPVHTLQEVMESNRAIARDVGALAEARRLAIQPSNRRQRTVP